MTTEISAKEVLAELVQEHQRKLDDIRIERRLLVTMAMRIGGLELLPPIDPPLAEKAVQALDELLQNPGRGFAAELAQGAAQRLRASIDVTATLRWLLGQALHMGVETGIKGGQVCAGPGEIIDGSRVALLPSSVVTMTVVAWEQVPDGALVVEPAEAATAPPGSQWHAYVRAGGRGVCVGNDRGEWEARTPAWPWERDSHGAVIVIAVGLRGTESSDELRALTESLLPPSSRSTAASR